jgi:hypothetical protein
MDFSPFGFEADVSNLFDDWLMPLTNFPLTDNFIVPSTQTTS